MDYRREIDGLRAVAVLPVLFFHAGFPGFSGGYVGVDIFFVISGYLITRLIIADLEAGSFGIAQFYERRARRILPALFLVIICVLPVAWLVMLPDEFRLLGESIGSTAIFLSNLYFLSKVDYFAPAAELQPLLHTWSLAVEEQFYIFFPPFMVWLWPRGRPVTLAVLALLFGASFTFAIWGGAENAERNFFFTGSRAWELAVGAACAVVMQGYTIKARQVPAAIGIAMILAAVIFFNKATRNPGFPTLMPVLGTAAVLLWGQSGTWVAAALSWRLPVGIGLISYSAYLWHFPLFSLTRIILGYTPAPFAMIGLVAVSLLLALLTWKLVEQPFRRRSSNPLLAQRRHLFGLSGLIMMSLLVFGLTARQTDGFVGLWRTFHAEEAQMLDVIDVARSEALAADDGACAFRVEAISDEVLTRLLTCKRRFGAGIVVLGDSHAIDIFGMVTSRKDSPRFILGLAKPACRPAEPRIACPYSEFSSFVEHNPGLFRLVIFSQSGAYLLKTGKDDMSAQELLVWMPVEAPVPQLSEDSSRIGVVLRYLTEIQRQTPVVWLGPRIEPQIRLTQFVKRGCNDEWLPRPGTAELFKGLDDRIMRESAAVGIPYVSQIDALDLRFPSDYGSCKELYWSDEDHYSAAGERIFGSRMDVIGLTLQAAGVSD